MLILRAPGLRSLWFIIIGGKPTVQKLLTIIIVLAYLFGLGTAWGATYYITQNGTGDALGKGVDIGAYNFAGHGLGQGSMILNLGL
jgi:hypothetical protein